MLHPIKTAGLLTVPIIILFSCNSTTHKNKKFSATISLPNDSITLANSYRLIDSALDNDLVILQTYEVKADSKVWVVAKKGFKVFVDKDKLCKKDGTPLTGKIIVKIKEVTNTDEMIAANTPTMSDGKMLISGGAYFLRLTNDGEDLYLKSNETMQVQLPNFKKNNMQLFYGDSTKTGMVNWRPASTKFEEQEFIRQDARRIIQREYDYDYKKIKDSIGRRPATFEECYKIYKDSVFKARCAYTIANRNTMSYKQEMAYILKPIEFPKKRFDSFISKNVAFAGCFMNSNSIPITSAIYWVTDTFPIYKETKTDITNNETKEQKIINYYEPMEINSLGWINCDRFYNVPISMNTEFQLKNGEALTMCRVYYKFKKLNSVLAEQLVFKNKTATQFKAGISLPIGEEVEVIILGVRKGKVIMDKKTTIIGNENKWTVNFKDISLQKNTAIVSI
jgi:hypothetical protein